MRNEDDSLSRQARWTYFLVGMALGFTLMHIWLGGGIW